MVLLYRENQLIIEDGSASIGINDHICFSSPVEYLNQIYSFIKKHINPQSDVFVYDYSATDTNLVFLYVLTLLKCNFIYNEKGYELSFAYAIPIKHDVSLRKFVFENLEVCLNNNQMVFLPSETLYLYSSIPHEGLIKIIHDERKTIKRNAQTRIEEVEFTDDFFDFWKEFDKTRFNEDRSRSFQDFFKYVYNTLDFRLFKYSVEGQLVAYNVCYYSKNQKVIYDVLFPWQNNDKTYRIGIYSMIKNLEDAFEMGWGYSMCYGIYGYKNAVLDKLKEDRE